MSSFTKPLVVRVLNDGTHYELVEPFEYYREDKAKNFPSIKVPAGFITDFASVPRIFWSVLPPFGRYSKSAVVHDYLCSLWHFGVYTRKFCDSIFLESMLAVKVPRWKVYTLYFGVRLYALIFCKNDRCKK